MAIKLTLNFSEPIDPRIPLALTNKAHQPKHILIRNVREFGTSDGLGDITRGPSRNPIKISATRPMGKGAPLTGIRTQGWRRE